MTAERTCQFLLQVTPVDGDLGGQLAAEEFALALRAELAELEVRRIDELPAGPAPEGTRAIELFAAFGLLLTVVQTVAVLPAVVAAIRQFAAGYARRGTAVRLTVAGVDLDPVNSSDRELEHVVQRLLELPPQAQTGTRSALVVANGRYQDERLARLRSPGQDALALARVLGDPAIGGFQVDLLVDADERTIRRRTAAFFADRDRDDVLLLHFSCHGVKDARGRLHLAAKDTDLSVLGATGVPASFVNDLLADTQSRRVVLVLDCCYSGAFGRGGQVRAGSEVHVAEEFGAGTGRIVLTASSATEYAFEGGELTQSQASPSAFTGALVAGLETGEADLDADGEISIDELYDYTYRTVRQSTPGQAPMKWSFGVEGNLVVARSVRPAALPSWIHDDLLSDRVVLRMEAVRGLSEILAGGKPGLQASAIGTLANLRDHDDSVRVRRAAAGALASAGHGAGTVPTLNPAPLGPTPAPPSPPMPPSPAAPSSPPMPPSPAGPSSPPTRPSPAAAAQRSAPTRTPTPQPTPQPTSSEPKLIPTPTPPSHGQPGVRRDWSALLRAGAMLTLLSLLLYLVAAFSDNVDWSGASPTWLAQLVAAGLLLRSGQPIWSGALVGMLAWAPIYLVLIAYGDVDLDDDLLALYAVADLVGVAALVCLAIPMLRTRPRPRALGAWRTTAAALVAALGLLTVLLAGAVVGDAADLDDGGAATATWFLLAVVPCALALPAAMVTAPDRRTDALVPVGWLFGALPLAIIASSEVFDSYGGELTIVWVLLVVVTVTATALTCVRPEFTGRTGNGPGRR